VDALIAMSAFSREKHREFGLTRDMEVVPAFLPPVDRDETPSKPIHSRPYFLFVGRLARIKGLHDVIPVFRENIGADLLVIGDGVEERDLRDQAGDAEAIKFLGRIEGRALSGYYRAALALIVPSVGFETFGFVLIEAFQQGTPVIARRIGPFPEMVSRCGGGELFATRDELAAAVRRLVSDAEHRERLSRNARAGYHANWTEEKVLPIYLDVVRRAAERRGLVRVAEALR
jgi:glycosyltransferase involved in cell wall biosynthesis